MENGGIIFFFQFNGIKSYGSRIDFSLIIFATYSWFRFHRVLHLIPISTYMFSFHYPSPIPFLKIIIHMNATQIRFD